MSDWHSLFGQWAAVGSRVTCSPAPSGSDEDWLVLSIVDKTSELTALGFEGGEFYTGDERGKFRSWRRGETNLIITPDPEFWHRFLTATALAKRFNLLEKVDRVALFQAVLYGNAIDYIPMPNVEPEVDF